MKTIIVDENLCIGCGACVSIDSEHFDFNDRGFAECVNDKNLDSPELASAVDVCPTSAIKIAEAAISTDDSQDVVDIPDCGLCENCECN